MGTKSSNPAAAERERLRWEGGREGGRAGELLAGADGKDELQARRVRAEERQKGFSFRTLFGTVVKHRLIQIHSAITLVHERQSGRNNN